MEWRGRMRNLNTATWLKTENKHVEWYGKNSSKRIPSWQIQQVITVFNIIKHIYIYIYSTMYIIIAYIYIYIIINSTLQKMHFHVWVNITHFVSKLDTLLNILCAIYTSDELECFYSSFWVKNNSLFWVKC